MRRILGTRKVGHAGTLDPMATGVLLVGVGAATRLLGYLAKSDKEYLATIRLGMATVTDDATGAVLTMAPPGSLADVDRGRVQAAVTSLTGRIEQVPSAVSAIKVGGKRSYALVRSGEQVELAAREVQVTSFEILQDRSAHAATGDPCLDLDVRVTCSTGTYVRALARDLGARLGVGGHLTALRRTRVGPWTVDTAVDLDVLQADPMPAGRLAGLGEIAAAGFAVLVVDADLAAYVRHGRPIPLSTGSQDAPIAILDGTGRLLALAAPAGGQARYLAVLAEATGA